LQPGLRLNAPQPMLGDHLPDDFACGEAVLDEWLKRRAMMQLWAGYLDKLKAGAEIILLRGNTSA
jgi:hypothetical protein